MSNLCRQTAGSLLCMSSLNLYMSDRECLINRQWLTDSVVSTSLEWLKAEYPAMGGLQPTIPGVKNDFDIQRGEFVQVSHCHVPLDHPCYCCYHFSFCI